ncbi:MAG: hypothetical protein PHC97_00845 [Patescibacteria group bacterium]|nr:hypothetical protein [Patescibacteria group bacterium]
MKQEFRCVLTNQEASDIIKQAKIINSYHAIDEYTGSQRTRVKNFEEKIVEDYSTKVMGKIARIGMKIELPEINIPTYLELKITETQFCRWEIEFEGETPEQYKNRGSIRGWQILIDQNK